MLFNLHFLHGFLGFSSDWDIFKNYFLPYKFITHSIESYLLSTNYKPNYNNKEKNILIGYSLGGRLALHSLIEKNHQWDAAIIISAHPGLLNENEKEARIKNDEDWANRFLNEPWNSVVNAWDSQGIFSGQKNNFNREENLYKREKIAKILTEFSLGKQENLRPMIKNIQIPILWLSGELDTKFALIGREMMSINKNIESIVIPHVGHRVPWEAPEKFVELCLEFMKSI
ncbi:MAG: alpha/beta fold hydrolase [Bdellovibrionota bacterium]